MHLITIDASPRQLSKLRNGHKVRVKKGEGFNLVVSPATYHRMSRTFTKAKGVDVQLTPEEIEYNKAYGPEQHAELKKRMEEEGLPVPMEGRSIFSKAGKWLKHAGKHIAKSATGKVVSSAVKVAAPAIATALLGPAGAPLGALIGEVGAKHASSAAEKAVGKKLFKPKPSTAPATKADIDALVRKYGLASGRGIHRYTGIESLKHANIGTYEADKALGELSKREFGSRHHMAPYQSYYDYPLAPPSRGTGFGSWISHKKHMLAGHGLYTGGSGLYAGGRSGHGLYGGAVGQEAIVGRNGGFVRHLPPALQSQPYSANYLFQTQMPPQYQQYEQGPAVEFY